VVSALFGALLPVAEVALITTCSFSFSPSVTSAEISLLIPILTVRASILPSAFQHLYRGLRTCGCITMAAAGINSTPSPGPKTMKTCRRHLNVQLTIRISNIEQHIIEHHVVDQFRVGRICRTVL